MKNDKDEMIPKTMEYLALWTKSLVKTGGVTFGVLGAASVIFPLANLSRNNIEERIQLFVVIILLIMLMALVHTILVVKKKSKTLYSSVKTRIVFEYNDLRKIIREDRRLTIVVPIHTRLDLLGDETKISERSVHRIFYEYLREKNTNIDLNLLQSAEKKQMLNGYNENVGQIGDWILLTSTELGFETNIKFLLIEEDEVEEKEGGFLGLKTLNKDEYVQGLISLINAIILSVEDEECVYIPLVGAGKANVIKPRDAMFLMEGILRFFKRDLRHEVHIVISEKDKKNGAEIHQLREIG